MLGARERMLATSPDATAALTLSASFTTGWTAPDTSDTTLAAEPEISTDMIYLDGHYLFAWI
jgi:hypothetical protein